MSKLVKKQKPVKKRKPVRKLKPVEKKKVVAKKNVVTQKKAVAKKKTVTKKKSSKILEVVEAPKRPLPLPGVGLVQTGVWSDTTFRELYEWCCTDPDKPAFFNALMNSPREFLAERFLRLPEECMISLIWLSQQTDDVEYSRWCIMNNVPWLYWVSDEFKNWCIEHGIHWLEMNELPPSFKGLYAPPCPWDDCPPVR
jgi:hypothetical protein